MKLKAKIAAFFAALSLILCSITPTPVYADTTTLDEWSFFETICLMGNGLYRPEGMTWATRQTYASDLPRFWRSLNRGLQYYVSTYPDTESVGFGHGEIYSLTGATDDLYHTYLDTGTISISTDYEKKVWSYLIDQILKAPYDYENNMTGISLSTAASRPWVYIDTGYVPYSDSNSTAQGIVDIYYGYGIPTAYMVRTTGPANASSYTTYEGSTYAAPLSSALNLLASYATIDSYAYAALYSISGYSLYNLYTSSSHDLLFRTVHSGDGVALYCDTPSEDGLPLGAVYSVKGSSSTVTTYDGNGLAVWGTGAGLYSLTSGFPSIILSPRDRITYYTNRTASSANAVTLGLWADDIVIGTSPSWASYGMASVSTGTYTTPDFSAVFDGLVDSTIDTAAGVDTGRGGGGSGGGGGTDLSPITDILAAPYDTSVQSDLDTITSDLSAAEGDLSDYKIDADTLEHGLAPIPSSLTTVMTDIASVSDRLFSALGDATAPITVALSLTVIGILLF